MSRVLPILFNTEMVRAILDGRKMVTRRVIKPQPVHNGVLWKLGGARWSDNIKTVYPVPCHSLYNRMPYQPGDILYVRETWQECCRNTVHSPLVHNKYCFRASLDSSLYGCIEDCGQICNWRPSIHMPKEAARIWLKVTDVRVERLKDITDEQAKAEGFINAEDFISTFLKIYPDCTEDSWLWVIEFERCKKPESEE